MKLFLYVGFLIFSMALMGIAFGIELGSATAQSRPPVSIGIQVVNGSNPGEVNITWNAVDGANYYRIGWIAEADSQAAGDDWLERFVFADVAGKTAYTITRLTPGIDYWFIVGSNSERYGEPRWQNWVSLRLNEDQTACPAATPTPSPTPAPTPAPTPTHTPTPVPVGDYDADDDGLIEVSALAQLDAMRHDLDGDGNANHGDYTAAFPNALTGMGCPSSGCIGYELTANLDFDTNGSGAADAGDAYWNDNWGWTPIGDTDAASRWNATFDGGGHKIFNLYISWADTDHVGLFRTTGPSSIIRNVGLDSIKVSGRNYVGGFVGSNGGAISNSHVAGTVSGNNYVGGLVGTTAADTTITLSHSSGNVTANTSYVGGLAGQTDNSVITASHSDSNVSGNSYAGGLIGSGVRTEIAASYSNGDVTGRYTVRRFRTSSNVRSVSGGTNVGGLIGSGSEITITSSYARGSVAGGESDVGGLVGGASSGIIVDSYCATNGARNYASGGELKRAGVTLVGTAKDGTSITNSYWDASIAGRTGQGGKTTRELKSPTANTGIYANWNPDWWDFGTATQYPALKYGSMDIATQRR